VAKSLIDLLNDLGDAVQRYDDEHAGWDEDTDPPLDYLRDAAFELHYRLTNAVTRPEAFGESWVTA
jgi:hypothetical protein